MNKTIVEQCSDYQDYKKRLKNLVEIELRNKTITSTNVYEDSLNFWILTIVYK